MIECTINDIDEINYFLQLMNQKSITVENFLENFNHYVMIKDIGFISYSVYFDRAEINYIYVIDNYRKKGYASKLLDYVISKICDLENITLEVNVNNIAAINLYKKFNFEIATIRKKYYGSEDAYLMIRR